MKELLDQVRAWQAEGAELGRAVVVRTFGSAPRPEGATLVATADGRLAGSVSGGCVEGAAFEEIQRVFMLDLLTDVAPKKWHKALILLLSAAMFGLAHLYQGPAGMAGNFIEGIVWGLYFLGCGRIWPMIISHALLDSVQIISVVIQIRQMGG